MNIAADGVRAQGIDVQCAYLGNLRSVPNLVAARRRVAGLARDFDVIHAQYGSACGLVTAAVEGPPKVISIRGNDWNVHNSFGFHYVHTRIARWMTRRSLRRYDAAVAVSERMAKDIRAYRPGLRVLAIPSPVDVKQFVVRDKSEARRELGFPDSTERWVLFNALNLDDPIKRFPLAKRAVDLANQRLGNVRLRLATNLPHRDVPRFTAACDLILCTSETEGWPNCVKEALACNVPFVATDVSDLAAIARQEASCRVVAEPDAEALANAICDALEKGASADVRKYALAMSVDRTTRKLVDLYESLVR